jgi:uncharacterized membrane protein YkoI
MKFLFALFVSNCLLVSMASGQAYAQLGENIGEAIADEFRNRNNNEARVQNELMAPGSDEEQTAISRREASDLARSSYPGRVLSIRLDGRRWRVRMDEEGTVFNVFVDSENGEVLRPSE